MQITCTLHLYILFYIFYFYWMYSKHLVTGKLTSKKQCHTAAKNDEYTQLRSGHAATGQRNGVVLVAKTKLVKSESIVMFEFMI